MTGERGSTIPLILGFFLLGLLVVAGSVAAADAYVQQRGLQDVCDGAAAAAAAGAADLGRGSDFATGADLRFADAQRLIEDYLDRDPSRSGVRGVASMSTDATTISLTCTQTSKIAFGAMFGRGGGVLHTVHSSARAPIS
ncbi:MAG: hypothetical protein ACRDWT_02640 [Jatrophihabitantaceae bacterium]